MLLSGIATIGKPPILAGIRVQVIVSHCENDDCDSTKWNWRNNSCQWNMTDYHLATLWLIMTSLQGRNHGRKVEGDQGLAPNTGLVRVQGYHPRKICENSDAKSCILVTTCCEISCFLKTTTKKFGDQYTVGPYGCCAYASLWQWLWCLVTVILLRLSAAQRLII